MVGYPETISAFCLSRPGLKHLPQASGQANIVFSSQFAGVALSHWPGVSVQLTRYARASSDMCGWPGISYGFTTPEANSLTRSNEPHLPSVVMGS